MKAIKENLNTSFLAQSADKIYYTGSERKRGTLVEDPALKAAILQKPYNIVFSNPMKADNDQSCLRSQGARQQPNS